MSLLGLILNHLQEAFDSSSTRKVHGLNIAAPGDYGNVSGEGKLPLLDANGKVPLAGAPQNGAAMSTPAVQWTGDGTTTVFTLPGNVGANEFIFMSFGDTDPPILQIRGVDYTRSGFSVTFAVAPATGAKVYFSGEALGTPFSTSGMQAMTRDGASTTNFIPPGSWSEGFAVVLVDGVARRRDLVNNPPTPGTGDWYYHSGTNRVIFSDTIDPGSRVDTFWGVGGLAGTDATTLNGRQSNTGTTASTIPVRNGSGQLPGDITGNAATATLAAAATLAADSSLLNARASNTGTAANTIPVRDNNGKLPGDILGTAAAATLAADSSLLNGRASNTGTTANTIPVRNGSGALPGDITGNAATATSATTATTASNATNLGGAPASSYVLATDNIQTVEFEANGKYPASFTNLGPAWRAPFNVTVVGVEVIVEANNSDGGFSEFDIKTGNPNAAPSTILSTRPRVPGNAGVWGVSDPTVTGGAQAAVLATTTFPAGTIFSCDITSGGNQPPTSQPTSAVVVLKFRKT